MKRALELAHEAAGRDEVPVGALIIHNGEIIAEGSNLRETKNSVHGHAELMAIHAASEKLKSWRLIDCTLVTTLEPCVMCAGAIVQSRIARLIYGASDPKGGAQSLFQIFKHPQLNHQVELTTGILKDECSQVLKDFFKTKR